MDVIDNIVLVGKGREGHLPRYDVIDNIDCIGNAWCRQCSGFLQYRSVALG
jgi:hypothetical protein